MGFCKTSISVFLISLPWLCVCQASEVQTGGGKDGEQRAQINLSESSGQLALVIGAAIIIDVFLTIFAFGYLSRETQKKVGKRYPFVPRAEPTRNRYPALTKFVRRRPSRLAVTLKQKLQQLRPNSYYVNGYRSFIKRTGEYDDIERQDVFKPTINYEFNDDQVQQSIDLVDTTFGVMNIDSEPCRKRTICEMERVATQYPIVSFIVKTVSPFVKGLSKYDDAVQRGANGEDCALYYDDCPYALDKLPKFFQQH
jgi:hypothetical protein